MHIELNNYELKNMQTFKEYRQSFFVHKMPRYKHCIFSNFQLLIFRFLHFCIFSSQLKLKYFKFLHFYTIHLLDSLLFVLIIRSVPSTFIICSFDFLKVIQLPKPLNWSNNNHCIFIDRHYLVPFYLRHEGCQSRVRSADPSLLDNLYILYIG